jgi:hypothetical protein
MKRNFVLLVLIPIFIVGCKASQMLKSFESPGIFSLEDKERLKGEGILH